jgi:hypothetical protein
VAWAHKERRRKARNFMIAVRYYDGYLEFRDRKNNWMDQ